MLTQTASHEPNQVNTRGPSSPFITITLENKISDIIIIYSIPYHTILLLSIISLSGFPKRKKKNPLFQKKFQFFHLGFVFHSCFSSTS